MKMLHRRTVRILFTTVIGALVLLVAIAPPSNFPTGEKIKIASGTPVALIAEQFRDGHYVRSASILSFLLRLAGSESAQSGTYEFEGPLSAVTIAYRIATGDHGVPPVRLTIPEGATVRDIAELVHQQFPEIASTTIVRMASGREGYLFPDTYLFPYDATASDIVAELGNNFTEKIGAMKNQIDASSLTMPEIITLASLVEREARTVESKKMVAGILMNRLDENMPLQVDAVFGYIFGRDTYSPRFSDLRVDSPYNTYTHKGIPPGPICNPGMDSIMAVLEPTKSPYFFYLTDRSGTMRYATSFSGHQANRRQFLE